MGFILLGIVLAIASVVLFAWMDWDFGGDFISGLAAVLTLGGIVCGIFTAPLGYTDYELDEEIPLISFCDYVSGDNFYLRISADNDYLYCYNVESEFATSKDEVYKTKSFKGNNITVIESDVVEDPVLQKYVKRAKKSFWSFAVLCDSYQYVFRVPTDSVTHDILYKVPNENMRYEMAG